MRWGWVLVVLAGCGPGGSADAGADAGVPPACGYEAVPVLTSDGARSDYRLVLAECSADDECAGFGGDAGVCSDVSGCCRVEAAARCDTTRVCQELSCPNQEPACYQRHECIDGFCRAGVVR